MPVCFTGKLQLFILQRTTALCSTKGITTPPFPAPVLDWWGVQAEVLHPRGLSVELAGMDPSKAYENLGSSLVILKRHMVSPKPKITYSQGNKESQSLSLSLPHDPHLHHAFMRLLSMAMWP